MMVIWFVCAFFIPIIVALCAALCIQSRNPCCFTCLCACGIVSIVGLVGDVLFHLGGFLDMAFLSGDGPSAGWPYWNKNFLEYFIYIGCFLTGAILLVLCACVVRLTFNLQAS